MRRRALLLLLGGAMTAVRALRAQQKAIPVIGFLNGTSPDAAAPFVAAFRQGLNESGYVDGQNAAIEYRFGEGRDDRLPALVADLVGRNVDVIVAAGGAPLALAAKSATSTLPIVFTGVGDPVALGLVASLARPGGNVTGFSLLSVELTPKRLELVSELVPWAGVIALLVNPNSANAAARITREVQDVARTRGMQLPILNSEGRHRKRNRRRFCDPPPTACRRARCQQRAILHQPARATRRAGGAPCRSGDLCIA